MLRHYKSLPEHQRRRYAGLEATKLPYGYKGYICTLFGIGYKTLRKGIKEISFPELSPELGEGKQRRDGSGRKKNCPPSMS